MLETPKSIGEPVVLASRYGKELIAEDFKHPRTGETYTYILNHMPKARPVMVFPLTVDRRVIYLRQFRHAAKEVLIEIPGGNPKDGQAPIDVASAELMEETGYAPGKLQSIGPAMWWEPDVLRVQYNCYLATDCIKIGEPQLDEYEYIEADTVPLEKWIEMIGAKMITDSKTIVLTMLALPYLGVTLKYD